MSDCTKNTQGSIGTDTGRSSNTPATTCLNGQDLSRSPDMIDRIQTYEPLNDDACDTMAQQSFPYPENGTIRRPAGQGCKVCVHNKYCEAFYWFRRNDTSWADDHVGLSCLSWSDSISDQVIFGNDADVNENTRRSIPNPVSAITSQQPDAGFKDSQFNDLGNGPSAP
jgi:hypothetical protein